MAAGAVALAGGPVGAIAEGATILGTTLFNIGECGTIGNIGCVKESDTAIDKKGELAARSIIEAVRLGKLSAAQGKQEIAGIWQQMNSAWTQKSRSGQTASFDGFCGAGHDPGDPPYYQQIGAAQDSPAATYLCGQTLTREQMFTQAFPALIDQLAAKAQQSAIGGALAGIAGAVGASAGQVITGAQPGGIPGTSILKAAGAVGVGILLLKVLL